MRRYRHRLALLLVMAFITVECVAAEPKPADARRAPMTVSEAKLALVEALKHNIGHTSKRTYNVTRSELIMGSTDSVEFRCSFSSLKNLTVASSSGFPAVYLEWKEFSRGAPAVGKSFEIAWVKRNKRYAELFIEALQVLKKAAADDDFAAFSTSAKAWMQSIPQAEMPDDARAYKLLAEDAFKRKDFVAALAAYGKALELFPMWPSGHYNAALLAAETDDYDLAAHHMRRYLVLAPDATDTIAAKDKLLLWQLKAK